MANNPRSIYDPSGSQQTGPIQVYIAHVVSIKDPNNEGQCQVRPQGVTVGNVPDNMLSWISHLGATTNHGASNGCHPGDKVVVMDMGAHGHFVTHKIEVPQNPRAGPDHDKNTYPSRPDRVPLNDGKASKTAPNKDNTDHTAATQTAETYSQGADINTQSGKQQGLKQWAGDTTKNPFDRTGTEFA